MPVMTGLLEDYTRRGEWHDFKIGGTRVGTKRLEVAEQAIPLLGQQVQAEVFEKESKNTNPNTGKPYLDRYLEQILPGNRGTGEALTETPTAELPPQQSSEFAMPGQAPAPAPVYADDRELKIMRQTATKVAVQLMAYASKENQKPENLIVLSDWLVNYYRFGSSKDDFS